MEELERLKKLVLQGGFDEESQQEVMRAERKLHDALAKDKLLESWPLKGFIDYLKTEVDRCEVLLKTDRTLTIGERDNIFDRIDICNAQLSTLSQERKGPEETIKQLLNAATSQSA